MAACADVAFAKPDVYRRRATRAATRLQPELAPSAPGARQMAAMNPNIRTHELPDIGHADLLECPAEAVELVTGFFREALASG